MCVGVEGKEMGMAWDVLEGRDGVRQVRTCKFMTFVYLAKSA